MSETTNDCSSDMMTIYLCLLVAINFGSIVLALWEAYVARNISTDLSEPSYIFKATASVLLVALVGGTVYFILSLSYKGISDALYFVKLVMVFVACCTLILLIFIPKIRYHHRKNPKERIIQVIQSITRYN